MWLRLLGMLFVILVLLAERRLSYEIDYSNDLCIAKALECNEQKIQLSPYKVSGIVIFNTNSDLDKTCSYGKKFFSCMKNAEELCKDRSMLIDKIKENRQFAISVCDRDGDWRKRYIESAYCINYFAIFFLDNCAMTAIKEISELYERGTAEFICRFYIKVRKCRTSLTQKYCGVHAGEVLRKVLLYHRDYDFMCARFEKEIVFFPKSSRAPDIEELDSTPKSSPSPDILTNTHENKEQEFENTNLHRIGYTMEYEKTSALSPEEMSTEAVLNEMNTFSFNPEIKENGLFTSESSTYVNPDSSLDATDSLPDYIKTFVQKDPPTEEYFSLEEKHYSSVKENKSSFRDAGRLVFNTSRTSHYRLNSRRNFLSSFSYEDYAIDFTTFGLYEIDQGVQYYLGCGYGTVSRTNYSLLKNTYCIWTNNLDQEKMFKCSIHIAEACIFDVDNLSSAIFDLGYRTNLLIYDVVDGIHWKKASIRPGYYKPNTKVFPPGNISCQILPKKTIIS
ncbi:hypothetical protein TNCT_562681 [Trichonephila clavata]|uniref:Uncharacterized protein n=1 Tax=Trichonephila clavata TaxID=2740835 RepID=A0A8X6GXJ6_TRICU|nr:hypothetical protein TNCT_562681 [Trichonephila clavata]